jgi:hypothetical protein
MAFFIVVCWYHYSPVQVSGKETATQGAEKWPYWLLSIFNDGAYHLTMHGEVLAPLSKASWPSI